jgi:hypothetical protein
MDAANLPLGIVYRQALLLRLIRLWQANTPLPGRKERVLAPALLERRCRCILAEGYGR